MTNLRLPHGVPVSALHAEHLRIQLEFTRRTHHRFLHGGAVHGLLCGALDHDLPPGLVPFAPESGRIHFEAGDSYNLGLTLFGDAAALAPKLLADLARLGADSRGPGAALRGNFQLRSVERQLQTATNADIRRLQAEAAALAAAPSVRLRFVSPLRLLRPEALQVPGATYLNEDCFPAGHFLERLWQRWHLLAHGEYAPAEAVPSPPPTVEARPRGLWWMDLPIPGRGRERSEKPRGMTLGGVLGEVEFHNLPLEWCALLALGRHFHAGRNTHYGLGRYALPQLENSEVEDVRPAKSFLERLAALPALRRALHRVAGDFSSLPASPEDLLPPLRESLLAGTCRPASHLRLRDQVVQEAFAQVFCGSVDRRLEECAESYRRGLARFAGAKALTDAFEEGYTNLNMVPLEALFRTYPRARLLTKFRAFYPQEPAVDLLRAWLAAPEPFQGREGRVAQGPEVHATHGLPEGTPLTPLLARFLLEEAESEPGERLVRLEDQIARVRRPEMEGAAQVQAG